jgi:DNA-binding NarL/FixJ family response regulator
MPLRVVLVDDDRRFRATARRALEAEGVEVVAELASGKDALATVRDCYPDVVLIDVRMPWIDGVEVARRLQGRVGTTMVILMSTLDADHGRLLAEGVAAGYLPKDELSLAAITELLAR